MAVSRNLHFYEWVFIAVFPSDVFFRVAARFAEEHVVGRDVFKNDRTVTDRVDIFFHCTVENLLWAGMPKIRAAKVARHYSVFKTFFGKSQRMFAFIFESTADGWLPPAESSAGHHHFVSENQPILPSPLRVIECGCAHALGPR